MTVVFEPAKPVLVPTADGRQLPVHRIYCVGRNYAEHAIEMGATGREPPFFFMKPAEVLRRIGPYRPHPRHRRHR